MWLDRIPQNDDDDDDSAAVVGLSMMKSAFWCLIDHIGSD